jgi:NH3-dependent NAD+ synthetase
VQLIYGVKRVLLKTGFNKVIVGLSGGLDSALVVLYCSKALGAANTHVLLMPSEYSQ